MEGAGRSEIILYLRAFIGRVSYFPGVPEQVRGPDRVPQEGHEGVQAGVW